MASGYSKNTFRKLAFKIVFPQEKKNHLESSTKNNIAAHLFSVPTKWRTKPMLVPFKKCKKPIAR